MRIGVIGAGITGLTVGLRLTQAGHQVTIWEAAPEPGGLASGFKDPSWQWPLERHYHHIFASDLAIQKLAKELNIPVIFSIPKTSLWYAGHTYRFDSPRDILTFPHLSPLSKFRLAFWLAYLKLPVWPALENQHAKQWILSHMGEEVWRVIWQPLFEGKFGFETERVSAAWFWARIHKRSRSLGYFTGGFQTLVDALVARVKQHGGKILTNTPVQRLTPEQGTKVGVNATAASGIFDRIIIAGPDSLLTKILPPLPKYYLEKIQWLRGLGAVNLVLALKQSFLTDGTYWLNINNLKMPFLAVVEHTNFIDPSHYGGDHLLYIGNYLPSNHQYFQLSETQLINLFTPHLQTLNPKFQPDWVRKAWVFKAPFAQPIITPHYRELLPDMQTPFPHIWWVSMQHVYPWDRGTNYAVEWGEKVAKLVEETRI